MGIDCAGICNYCGRHANKYEREHGFAFVRVGVTALKMHHECAKKYRQEGLMPTATFTRCDKSLKERINRYLDPQRVNGRLVCAR